MSILDAIVETKYAEIEQLKLQGFASVGTYDSFQSRSLVDALSQPGLAVLAEVKKASPSKGIICNEFEPVTIAKDYIKHGAVALSVLTDEQYFKGHIDYLMAIKKQVDVPVLRKDFILDSIQITQAKSIGADAVLLILAIVTLQQAQHLHDVAISLGLDVLVEIHDQADVDKLRQLKGVQLIGINNRNLRTFEVDLQLALQIKAQLEQEFANCVFVAESGYCTYDQLDQLKKHGFDATLIGEGLVKNKQLKGYFKHES